MNNANMPIRGALATTFLAFALAATAAAQAPAALDLEKAAAVHDRAGWPTSGLLRGVQLPEGVPGLERGEAQQILHEQILHEQILHEQGFVAFGDDLLSTRSRRVVELREGMRSPSTLLHLEVLVASSERAAQDAMLTLVARTHSMRLGADRSGWTRAPFGDETSSGARAWAELGDVRIGLAASDGVGRLVFTRGNVLVRIVAEETSVLTVATAVDALLRQSPLRSDEDDCVTRIQIADQVAWRATTPVVVERQGAGELQLEFAVTGGMVTTSGAGNRVYYAGDAGSQTVRVQATDVFGFPSEATVTFEVAGK